MANIARPTKIWDQTLNDWVFLAGVVDTTKSYTYTADQTFPGITATSINNGPIVGRNKIINGDFSIWQRGSSFTPANGATLYSADRFFCYWDGNGSHTISRQTFAPGSAPAAGYESQYFFRHQQTTAGSGGTYMAVFGQTLEDVRTFAAQTITISFWIKTDIPRVYSFFVDQGFGTGGSSSVNVAAISVPTTTSWQRVSYTINVPSVAGKTIGVNSNIGFRMDSNYINQTQTIDIWGMQVEVGPVATPFHTATVNQQTELAACQRYYYKVGPSDGSSSSFLYSPLGMANATTQVIVTFPFPQIMRVKPTSIEYTNPRVSDGTNVSTATSLVLGDASASLGSVNVNGSGFTIFRNYWMMNNSNSSIAFNAEF